MAANKITILTDKDRDYLKSKSPAVLPDNPSGKGWTASQIKIKFYEGLLLLFEWLKTSQNETSDLLVTIKETTEKRIEQLVIKLQDGSTTVKKASCDGNGKEISKTYSTIEALNSLITSLTKESEDGSSRGVLKYITDTESGNTRNINQIEIDLDTLKNNLTTGTTTVGKANSDSEGNSIKETYINKNKIAPSKTSADTSLLPTLEIVKALINDLSETIVNGSTESLDTLKELADALGEDPNFATTITNLIGTKLSIEDANKTYLTKLDASSTYATKDEISKTIGDIDSLLDYINGEAI